VGDSLAGREKVRDNTYVFALEEEIAGGGGAEAS